MKKVDMSQWKRREIFEFFSGVACPYYSLTYTLEVTRVYSFAKEKGLSFYYCMCWLVTKAVNSVEAFRYMIKDGQVYELEKRDPSFTDIRKGEELFYIVTVDMSENIESFCKAAGQKSAAQSRFIDYSQENEALVYLSCLPTLRLSALTNERDEGRDDSIPRIAWGKFEERDGRKELGLSIEVNHRFIDGVHLGMFNTALEKLIKEL